MRMLFFLGCMIPYITVGDCTCIVVPKYFDEYNTEVSDLKVSDVHLP